MSIKVIGSYDQLMEIVEREHIDKVVVALSDRRGKLPVEALLSCKMRGVEVEEAISFNETIRGKLLLEEVVPSWLIFSPDFTPSPWLQLHKRIVDVGLSTLGLLLVTPLLALIACLIKLDSRGPVFFSQERVGEKGKTFVIYKFRSMYVDSELDTGPVFADKLDPRVTWIGKWLRLMRLDELPQLLNVLKGEMSFVGPRPERPFFVNQYTKEIPYYGQRASVKPGITGWAQVNYHYGATVEDAKEKLRFDLYYVKNMSMLLDLIIMLKTLKIAILFRGAR